MVLLIWAHLIRPTVSGLDFFAIFLAGIIGMAGAITAPWPAKFKGAVTILYIGLVLVALPFLALLSVCSTGDCL